MIQKPRDGTNSQSIFSSHLNSEPLSRLAQYGLAYHNPCRLPDPPRHDKVMSLSFSAVAQSARATVQNCHEPWTPLYKLGQINVVAATLYGPEVDV